MGNISPARPVLLKAPMPSLHRRTACLTFRAMCRRLLVTTALGLLSQGSWAQNADNGAALYANYRCGNCHGDKTIATNVGHIQLGVDAANIKNASYGLVGIAIGTQMATYQTLPDDNFNDLAAFIAREVTLRVGGNPVATCTSAGTPTASALATAAPCPPPSTGSPVTSSGGGGCTLGHTDADLGADPLWSLLLGGAAWVLRRRSKSVA